MTALRKKIEADWNSVERSRQRIAVWMDEAEMGQLSPEEIVALDGYLCSLDKVTQDIQSLMEVARQRFKEKWRPAEGERPVNVPVNMR